MMKKYLVLLIISSLFLAISCSKKEPSKLSVDEKAKSIAVKSDTAQELSDSDISLNDSKSGEASPSATAKTTDSEKEFLQSNFVTDFAAGKDRYLEYNIDLTYKTKNIHSAREDLLKIIARYGFLTSSSSSINDYGSNVNAVFSVRAMDMYKALTDLKVLGKLMNENISVEDHTENMAWNNIKSKREKERINRKSQVISQVGAENKYLEQREETLSASEDGLDNALFEEWKIKDKVSWAKIKVNLFIPEKRSVVVPDFKDAFVIFLSNLLQILFYLISVLPYLVIIGLFIWKWKWIKEKILSIFVKFRNKN